MTHEDEEHLHLLSIFHFGVAGLGALCSFFPVIYLAGGIAMIHGGMPSSASPEVQRSAAWLMVTIASVAILGGLTISACLAWSGRCLQLRKHRTFCLVMAGLSCLSIPFGTVLGVFTIVVLCRDGVKAAFDAPRS